ncbi:MAG: large conductance mechanosensitive channel protein MscL [Thermoanaerobaculia bacterium]
MGFVKEFREFAVKGSVMDLAFAVVIGAAFGKIIDSLVNDILMPPLGLLLGGMDFTNHFVTLRGEKFATLAEAQAAGSVTLNYGMFVNAIVSFLIIGFTIFLIVRRLNAAQRKEAMAVVATTRACPECLSDIPLDARRCKYCAVTLGTTTPAAVG